MNKDQASSLREKFKEGTFDPDSLNKDSSDLSSVRAISFTSGKGGVGKTSTVINLAIQLAKKGKKVFLVDADLGLANIDIMLGLTPQYTIDDLLTGKRSINDIIMKGPEGIDILPGSSGVNEMSELDREQQAYLLSELSKLQSQYDYFLIDTGAGIASSVLRFNASADEICVITTVEPTAMTDAYALMKIMSTKYQVRKFNLIVNQATPTEAKNVHQRLEAVAQRYLPIEILFIGNVPKDPMLNQSIRKQVAMSVWAPNSHVTRAYEQIATQIDIHPGQAIDDTPTSSFWERVGIWKARR